MFSGRLQFNLSIIYLCCALVQASLLTDTKCGYKSCTQPKAGYINVHMVAHTHDDVGWLKTVDQLYYGNKAGIQRAAVQYIIDSSISSLLRNPQRRFIYVETYFFWKWWLEQSNFTHSQVQELVNEGRLEFVGGGWSMHDEGVVHYHSMLDQMSYGFRKLKETFGDCGRPRAGWQIDPFGHSRESASMMARFGFDSLFFGRLDKQEKVQRFASKTAEMVWETSNNLDGTDLFTGILHELYVSPRSFCFDIFCNDEPIIDNKESPEYNADAKAKQFLDYIKDMSRDYKSSNVLVTMGMDFHYQAAHQNFINIDRLINAVNELHENGSKVNLFYSTPSCYAKAINDEGLEFTTRQDDFFPYASSRRQYWTGYFTSRPTLKYYERIGNNFLQICKQLYTIGNIDGTQTSKLEKMKSAMGILQHHDAVTGTEKQHVAYDYARLLNIGFENCQLITDAALRTLMSKQTSESDKIPVKSPSDLLLKPCLLLNISACDITEENKNFVVTIYNPLSRQVSKNVRLPVSGNGENVAVYDPSGVKQTVQIVEIPAAVRKIPGRFSSAMVEIIFVAANLPALGYRSYYVVANDTSMPQSTEEKKIRDEDSETFTINGKSITQSFWWYKSSFSSGAYVFRPQGDLSAIDQSNATKRYSGPIVHEIHQSFNGWVNQVIRKYKGSNVLEYHWQVGPIPLSFAGKEVITRYQINSLASSKTFYTDSNGREMVERVRDARSSYKSTIDEPVAGNYYPVTTRIMINDTKTQLSVITDRAQGGSSLNDGQIELMLHRRLLYDDGWGVEEVLNEKAFGQGLVARGTHYVTLGHPDNQSAIDRLLVQEQVLSAWMFFTQTTKTLDEWKTLYNMEYSGLNTALPPNVQITTLEPWSVNSYLIRLEHIMEKTDDDTDLSKPTNVNLETIFAPFEITSVEETTLGGNLESNRMVRLVWKKTNGKLTNSGKEKVPIQVNNSSIELIPMEIRTFIVKVKFNN